jgi:predicted MFS family arabinose efflux permease
LCVVRLPRLTVDLTALRSSRELRWLVLGDFVSSLGTQAALVALPYQVYLQTRSPLLTGLLGAAELGPLVAMALLGGALADSMDRRRLLALDQFALVAIPAALCAAAIAGSPPLILLYVLGGLLAGAGALQNVARSAIVPNLVERAEMPAALAANYGLYQLALVFGPGLGGLLISGAGVAAAYAVDAASCLAMLAALRHLSPQPPAHAGAPVAIRRSIVEGLGFVRRSPALLGSFAIDLSAMTFGMPRALFPVLAVSVYGAGASGTGLLFAAVSAGAAVAALTTRWLDHVRRLGLVTIGAVCAWGVAIAGAGLVSSLWAAAALLALAGAADSVSAVCRSVINQTVTPDALRGRMSSVFSLVVTSGPRLGDIEAGAVAAATSTRFSVLSGGLACVAGAVLVAAAFPQLARYDKDAAIAQEAAIAQGG